MTGTFIGALLGVSVVYVAAYIYQSVDEWRTNRRDERARAAVLLRMATIDVDSLSPYDRIQYDFERTWWGIA